MGSFVQILQNLGASRIIAIGLVMLGIMGFFAYLIGSASTPSLSLMYSQLEPNEAAKIIDKLDAMGVPNDVRGDGTQIYVPSDRLARLRMEMAQDGLPSGGMGYEIFDKTDILSASGSMIDINKLRALEGELGKSIGAISGVSRARVHLVLPKRELFSREKTDPSASIVLKMKGSARLSASQVQAIQHLVASAVPQLQTDHIAIVDDKGTLLAKNQEGAGGGENMLTQMDSRLALEHKLAKTVETLLEKSLGFGKAKVEVAADLDFDRVTINSEEYNPDGQVVRSVSNTGEDNTSSEGAAGGTISAQNSLPEGGKGAAGAQGSNTSKRTEENTSYEISKTIKIHQKETGAIKHLSVAVLVDGIYGEAKEGKAPPYTPRTQEELDKIKLLVKTAIGFKEDRGDKVEVVNMQFSAVDTGDLAVLGSESSWMPKLDMNKIIQFTILSVVGLLILLLIVRPVITRLIQNNPAMAEAAAAEGLLGGSSDSPASLSQKNPDMPLNPSYDGQGSLGQAMGQQASLSSPQNQEENRTEMGEEHLSETMINVMNNADGLGDKLKPSSFKKVGEVIDKYPEDVVSLLRTWMYEEPWKK